MRHKTERITLCFTPEVANLLQAYADATMQSRSRAVSMLILNAVKGKEVDEHGQEIGHGQQELQ